jgi:protein gp37
MTLIEVNKLIKTLNPVCGCTIGCSYCYARRINQRFKIIEDFSTPTFMENAIKRIGMKRANNFLMTSMSDFSDWKPEWRERVFKEIAENPQHRFLFLTKHPERVIFKTELSNVWMGVTVTHQNDVHRVDEMLNNIKCSHYFITFEPLFGEIVDINLDKIGWIVIGTETGNRKGKVVTKEQWARSLSIKGSEKGIPVFMKAKMGEILPAEEVRQELPIDFISPLRN